MKKFLLALALFACSLGVQAQAVNLDMLSVYSIALDTVTNTGTVTWTSPRVPISAGLNATVYISVTKISGTVGGTVTLQGSVNGTTFKALNTVDTQTAEATITATDATNTYHYRLMGNPFPYYRVSWTGTGTMAASATCKVLTR